jgi:hypothetical protein
MLLHFYLCDYFTAFLVSNYQCPGQTDWLFCQFYHIFITSPCFSIFFHPRVDLGLVKPEAYTIFGALFKKKNIKL